MLHEILFALQGKLGSVIIEVDKRFIVNPSLDFISKSEAELIEKLVILGLYYRKLKQIIAEDSKSFNTRVLKFDSEAEEEQFEKSVIGNSSYVKAVCAGVNDILNEYDRVILKIEQKFLEDKIFSFSNLAVEFSKFYSVLPESVLMFEKIEEDGLKGGQLIDFLYQCSLNGNFFIKEFYSNLLENCFGILYEQSMLWILHGRLFDKFDEFFIYKLERNIRKKGEMTSDEVKKVEAWDGTYSIRYSYLPRFVITPKTAEKILFIGKSVRVLLETGGSESKIFSLEIIDVVKNAAKFDFLNFQIAIEKIRAHVASKFLKLFTSLENIKENLLDLRNYYLLGKGEFYHVFIEESEQLFKFPPSRYASSDVNSKVFSNSLVRLNWLDNPIVKKMKFIIQNNGFSYPTFTTMSGLIFNGNVSQNNGCFRFLATKRGQSSGCLWHTLKQNIENGFDMTTEIRFRRAVSSLTLNGSLPASHVIPPEFENQRDQFFSSNVVAFTIQNYREINSKK
jgi:gamma-tubulin complex component 4